MKLPERDDVSPKCDLAAGDAPLDAESSLSDAESASQQDLKTYRITIAYDGSQYFGWQRQPDQPTVQEVVEDAIAATLDEPGIRAHASSRTDTGVHAVGQSAIFRTDRWPTTPDKLPLAINTKLPRNVVVRQCEIVPESYHPLRNSTGKRYRYNVYCSRIADPLQARMHWWVRRQMHLEPMQAAAELLVGEHDFFSFQSAGSPRKNTVRHVRKLEVHKSEHLDGHMYRIEIEANGFLYNMVRNIVGTLVQVAVERERPEWVTEVLAAKDRRLAGATAPPQGLVLVEVMH